MSSIVRYQFLAFFGSLGRKNLVVDDVLLSHEQELYPTTSLDENCNQSEIWTDQNYYVDLRQTYLALKLKFVKGVLTEVTLRTKFKKRAEKKQIG